MAAEAVEVSAEVIAGVTEESPVGVTAVVAEAVEVSVAGSAGVTAVAAEVKRISVPSNFSMYRLNFFLKNCFFKYLF